MKGIEQFLEELTRLQNRLGIETEIVKHHKLSDLTKEIDERRHLEEIKILAYPSNAIARDILANENKYVAIWGCRVIPHFEQASPALGGLIQLADRTANQSEYKVSLYIDGSLGMDVAQKPGVLSIRKDRLYHIEELFIDAQNDSELYITGKTAVPVAEKTHRFFSVPGELEYHNYEGPTIIKELKLKLSVPHFTHSTEEF